MQVPEMQEHYYQIATKVLLTHRISPISAGGFSAKKLAMRATAHRGICRLEASLVIRIFKSVARVGIDLGIHLFARPLHGAEGMHGLGWNSLVKAAEVARHRGAESSPVDPCR